MRTVEQQLRAAFGDRNYHLPDNSKRTETEFWDIYDLELPDQFQHGLPHLWQIAILKPGTQSTENRKATVVHELNELINARANGPEAPPMALISDDPHIRMIDELPDGHPKVFALDNLELKSPPDRQMAPRNSPIIKAMRRSIGATASAMLMSPYVPNRPASAWRFFGRKDELEHIIQSAENMLLVGARRMGKTSLLLEAQRRFNNAGYRALYINVQDCQNENDVLHRLMEQLSEREYASLQRRRLILREKALELALRRISASQNIVLLIDELGNIINKSNDDWRILGILRSFAQSGKIKIVSSGFQEFLLRQQTDFEGPWVNFLSVIRVKSFDAAEVGAFVQEPWTIWGRATDGHNLQALREIAVQAVGRHPLALQYFGQALFSQAINNDEDLLDAANEIVGARISEVFAPFVEEAFHSVQSSLLKALFLKECEASRPKPMHVSDVLIDEDSIDRLLGPLGLHAPTIGRRNILSALEVRGLTEPEGVGYTRQRVIAPIVHRFLRREYRDLDRYIERLCEDIVHEAHIWSLRSKT